MKEEKKKILDCSYHSSILKYSIFSSFPLLDTSQKAQTLSSNVCATLTKGNHLETATMEIVGGLVSPLSTSLFTSVYCKFHINGCSSLKVTSEIDVQAVISNCP